LSYQEPSAEGNVITYQTVSTQYRNVTYGRTDRQTDRIAISISSVSSALLSWRAIKITGY